MAPATPRNPRYRSLDLWRAVACLSVVIFHSSFYATKAGGNSVFERGVLALLGKAWLGVPLFFVISGYCISATCDSHRRSHRPVTSYFLRRFRRIYPPFWIYTVAALVVIATLVGTGHGDLVDDGNHPVNLPATLGMTHWLGNLTLTESWIRHVLGTSGPLYFMGQTWTLCYEEQFYAVCGLMLLMAPRRFFQLSALVSVIVVGLMVLAVLNSDFRYEGFFFDGQWLVFGLGILVYYRL